DAYVELVRGASLVEAVAASLTEGFAPDLMALRLAAWRLHYPFVAPAALAYFEGRVVRGREDGDGALAVVVRTAVTPELEERAVAALRKKCEILWTMLDAIEAACR